MTCREELGQILIDRGDNFIIEYADWQQKIGDNQFTNEKCLNTSTFKPRPIHVQKADGTIVATKAVGSNDWIRQPNPNGKSYDSNGGRKSRRHKRKTLKRKTKRRRYKHRRSRRTRR